jgi:hypothetical protein
VLPLLLTFIFTAADSEVAIVERSTLGISAQAGAQLRAKLKVALEQVGLEVVLVPDSCADRSCLLGFAKGGCAVGMSVVKNKKGLTVDLEAVKDDVVLLQQTFLLMPNEVLEKSPDAQVFAHQLQSRLAKDRPVATTTVPEQEKLTPKTEVVETKPEWTEPPARSAAPSVIGGVSGGVGALGIGLIIASVAVKGGLDTALQQQPVVTTLNRVQAQQQADLSNALMAAGLASLGLGIAGGATALGLGVAAK